MIWTMLSLVSFEQKKDLHKISTAHLKVTLVALPPQMKNEKISFSEKEGQQPSLSREILSFKTKKKEKIYLKKKIFTKKNINQNLKEKIRETSTQFEKNRAFLKIFQTQTAASLTGNVLSQGSTKQGVHEAQVAENPEEILYFLSLKKALQEFWALPLWLSQRGLRAELSLFFNRTGALESYRWIQRSGHPVFDQKVEEVLTSPLSLPHLPASLQTQLIEEGIRVGFPL